MKIIYGAFFKKKILRVGRSLTEDYHQFGSVSLSDFCRE